MAHEDEISEKQIINFLKKNKNFFIKNSELVNELNFPTIDNSSDKVVDLEAYSCLLYTSPSPRDG